MKTLLLFILLILTPINSQAFDEWTKEDTKFQLTFTTLKIVDWLQTKKGIREGCYETNPLLGKYPSQERINYTIGTGIIAHALVARILPKECRRLWQMFFIGWTSHNVVENYKVVGVTFKF